MKKLITGLFSTVILTLSLGLFSTVAIADDQSEVQGDIEVYRLWHPWTGEHLYTSNWGEVSSLEANTPWIYEGVGFKTSSDGVPVYRLYNKWTGGHMYTVDTSEKDSLSNTGWDYEGIAFNTPRDGYVKVYRLFNPYQTGPGNHLWTTDLDEYNELDNIGWTQEGVSWYATSIGEMLPWDERKPIQPMPEPQYSEEDLFAMEWAPRIDNYNYGWPLYGYGDAFARAAYRNGMDPRTAPAIARIESGSGRVPLYRYGAGNCWGWMSMLTNDFESSIYLYCEKFSRSYGSTLTYNGAVRYAGWGGYSYTVQNEMNKI